MAWTILVVSVLCRSVLSTVVALLLWSVLPNVVGFQTTTVMSGSMEPRLQVGDAIITHRVDAAGLARGQVLLFDDPDHPGTFRMHRLVELRGDGRLVTKGDANRSQDSSTVGFDAVHGAAFLRIPFAGLPNLWIRTGQPVPLVVSGVLAIVLVGGVRLGRLLEEPEERARRRHRGIRLPGTHRAAAAVAALLVLPLGAVLPSTGAHAAYSAVSSVTGNTWGTACADRIPTNLGTSPALYWGYGTGSGQDVTDLSGQNDTGTSPAPSDASPVSCTSGFTPAIRVGASGKGLVVEKASRSFPASMTIATWFNTSVPGGVLADFGDSKVVSPASTSTRIDRVLYMRGDGNLSFGAETSSVAGLIGNTIYCTSAKSGGYADGTWHLAVATFSYAGGCSLTIDSSAAVTTAAPAISLQLNGYTGYWRFGYDAVTSSDWTGATAVPQFQGLLDESQVYNAVVSAAPILARGH